METPAHAYCMVFFLLLRIHSDTAAVQISQRAVIFGVGSQLEICTVVINQELFASRKEYSYFARSPVYTRCCGVMVRFETRLDATLPGSCFTRNPRRLHDIIVFHGMKLGLCWIQTTCKRVKGGREALWSITTRLCSPGVFHVLGNAHKAVF